MEEIDYLTSYEEDEIEKIFDDWTFATAKNQTYDWVNVIWYIIGGALWYYTHDCIYFILFFIYASLSFQITGIHRRQTRIAKYLIYLKNKD